MKCGCSRDTTAITIASLYIFGSVLVFSYELFTYLDSENYLMDPERKKKFKSELMHSMLMCGLSVLVSSLFIVAIVKRIQLLIIPWLLFAVYVFYFTFEFMYWWFIGAGMGGASASTFVIILLVLVASVAFEIFVCWLSCSLFKQIRQENVEKLERANKSLI